MDAGESFIKLVNTYEEKVYTNGTVIEWILGELAFYLFTAAHQPFMSDFTQCNLSTPESDNHNLLTPLTGPTPILREWAKVTLVSRSWRDALVTAANVGIFYYHLSLVA